LQNVVDDMASTAPSRRFHTMTFNPRGARVSQGSC
jgi:hypothetical protein